MWASGLRIIGILLLIGLLCALAIGIMKVQSEKKRTRMFSCLSSVNAFLAAEQPAASLLPSPPVWSTLDQTESDRLLKSAEPGRCLHGSTGTSTTDPWGQPIHIAIRSSAGRKTEYLLWSAGPDRISGTEDDVVVPYGEKPPPLGRLH